MALGEGQNGIDTDGVTAIVYVVRQGGDFSVLPSNVCTFVLLFGSLCCLTIFGVFVFGVCVCVCLYVSFGSKQNLCFRFSACGLASASPCRPARSANEHVNMLLYPSSLYYSVLYYTIVCYVMFYMCRNDVSKMLRANCYTPDPTKMNIRLKLPLKVHWTIPVTIHWTGDNPLESTTDK